MVMQSLRRGAFGGFLKYILLGILGMAVGGLVVMDVRGVFTGGSGVSSTDVAKIDSTAISIRDFDRALRRSVARYNISVEQAHQLGITKEVLSGEIRKQQLMIEAKNMGLEIGRAALASKVSEVIRPQVPEGGSMKDTLEQILRYQGMSEPDFLKAVKVETSNTLMMNAIQTSFAPASEDQAKALYTFQNQTRDVELLVFPNKDIKNIEEPKEEQLKRLYDALKAQNYEIPEYRSVQYGIIDPNTINLNLKIAEDQVKKTYEDNIKNFAVGEQFILTQALVKEEEKANAIYKATQDGKDLKSATITVLGDKKGFYENIPFEVDMMLPPLREVLDGREIDKVMPPVKTMLGYHVVKLTNILPPSTRSFAEVKLSIETELLAEKKAEAMYEVIQNVEKQIIDGTAFADISGDVKFDISNLDLMDSTGNKKDGSSAVDVFEEGDRAMIVQTIYEVNEGEEPMLYELPSGKFIAFNLSAVEPVSYQSYESVQESIKKQFIEDQQAADNKMRVQKFLAELETGGSSFAGLSKDNNKTIRTLKNIGIQGDIPAPLTEAQRPTLFTTTYQGYNIVNFGDSFGLIHVIGYSFPEVSTPPTDAQRAALESIKAQLSTEVRDEAFQAYLRRLDNVHPAKVNQSLLDRYYTKPDETN